jgi:hypothetical protein
MFNNTEDLSAHVQLRQKAETRISGGNAPATKGWTLGAASLMLLHRLASNPDTASDALKLLHELQVHQVELDLQHEHINDERQALDTTKSKWFEMTASTYPGGQHCLVVVVEVTDPPRQAYKRET